MRTITFGEAAGQQVRTDASGTPFLAEPGEHDSGELLIADTYRTQRIKLPAGDLVLYPACSVHRGERVTRSVRLASFFWLQSMVRGDEQRRLLFQMDMHLLKPRQQHRDSEAIMGLTGTHHNLLRMWTQV